MKHHMLKRDLPKEQKRLTFELKKEREFMHEGKREMNKEQNKQTFWAQTNAF